MGGFSVRSLLGVGGLEPVARRPGVGVARVMGQAQVGEAAEEGFEVVQLGFAEVDAGDQPALVRVAPAIALQRPLGDVAAAGQ